jgi:hypothetical protein
LIEKFLTSAGRIKYIKPIYEQLVKTPQGRERASAIFDKARGFYHPIARTAIEEVLSRESEASARPFSDLSQAASQNRKSPEPPSAEA